MQIILPPKRILRSQKFEFFFFLLCCSSRFVPTYWHISSEKTPTPPRILRSPKLDFFFFAFCDFFLALVAFDGSAPHIMCMLRSLLKLGKEYSFGNLCISTRLEGRRCSNVSVVVNCCWPSASSSCTHSEVVISGHSLSRSRSLSLFHTHTHTPTHTNTQTILSSFHLPLRRPPWGSLPIFLSSSQLVIICYALFVMMFLMILHALLGAILFARTAYNNTSVEEEVGVLHAVVLPPTPPPLIAGMYRWIMFYKSYKSSAIPEAMGMTRERKLVTAVASVGVWKMMKRWEYDDTAWHPVVAGLENCKIGRSTEKNVPLSWRYNVHTVPGMGNKSYWISICWTTWMNT